MGNNPTSVKANAAGAETFFSYDLASSIITIKPASIFNGIFKASMIITDTISELTSPTYYF